MRVLQNPSFYSGIARMVFATVWPAPLMVLPAMLVPAPPQPWPIVLYSLRRRSTGTCTSRSVSKISIFKSSPRSLPLNESRYPFSQRPPGSMYTGISHTACCNVLHSLLPALTPLVGNAVLPGPFPIGPKGCTSRCYAPRRNRSRSPRNSRPRTFLARPTLQCCSAPGVPTM